jgi:hypothetical protein
MDHETATHALRCLCIDKGSLYDEDALDTLINELKQANKANGMLIAERDEARRKVAELILTIQTSPHLHDVVSDYAAVEACKKIAEKYK